MNNAYVTLQDEQFQEWFSLRQLLLRAYCQLSRCLSSASTKPSQQNVESFCQLLIDYASFGHFCIYERLLNVLSLEGSSDSHVDTVFSELQTTTEAMLQFNDIHETDEHFVEEIRFAKLLSRIGEVIAQRLDLEDDLVATAHIAPVLPVKAKPAKAVAFYA